MKIIKKVLDKLRVLWYNLSGNKQFLDHPKKSNFI